MAVRHLARSLGLVTVSVFVLTRIFILCHTPVMTDANVYYELSRRVSWGTIEIYKEFPFAYPFLSWLAICWPPILFDHLSFGAYQTCLHAMFFALEIAVIAAFFFSLRRETEKLKIFFKALLIYSVLSIFLFNLIYDRVDLLMTLSLLGLFIFWERCAGLHFLLGFLLKLIPIALWPLKFIELWRVDRKRALISIWIPLAAIALLVVSDRVFFAGEIAALANHSSRGIQVESLWATPFELMHILGFDRNGHIEMIFGAHEVISDFITDDVLGAAKIFGFIAIMALYAFARIDMRTWAPRARGFLIFIFSFLCFQRVLSTQFLLWAAPFLAISLALNFDLLLFVLSVVVFALTCVIFSPGYGGIIEYDPLFTTLLALRNALLLALFILSLRLRPLGQREVQDHVHE